MVETSAAPVSRVAYLTGEYPKASHTFILREVLALRALGFEVETCSIRRPPSSEHIGTEEADAAASTFHVLEAAKSPATLLKAQIAALKRSPSRYFSTLKLAFRTGRPGARGTLWQLFYFLEAVVLAEHLRATSSQHLHNHFADSSANVAMLAGALAEIPFSYTLHGPAELFEPESWHLREKTARAAFVACISYFARSQAMLFSDQTHWDKLKIIHCGVTPENYEAGPETGDPAHLVFVGRLTGIKGVRLLIEALIALTPTHPDLRLSLIGDGADRAALEALAQPLGERVQFLGYRSQSEVAATLAEGDFLVLPSFAEGVPVVLMEAMASVKPVIATRVAGVPELVEHEVSGLLIPPGDPDALRSAITRLADDPALRARMGQAGRAKVTAEFDIAKEATRMKACMTACMTSSDLAALPIRVLPEEM